MDWAILGFWVVVGIGFALLRFTSLFEPRGLVVSSKETADRSVYGDKRLSRDDAHHWADTVERGLRQMNRRIRILTFLVAALSIYAVAATVIGR